MKKRREEAIVPNDSFEVHYQMKYLFKRRECEILKEALTKANVNKGMLQSSLDELIDLNKDKKGAIHKITIYKKVMRDLENKLIISQRERERLIQKNINIQKALNQLK